MSLLRGNPVGRTRSVTSTFSPPFPTRFPRNCFRRIQRSRPSASQDIALLTTEAGHVGTGLKAVVYSRGYQFAFADIPSLADVAGFDRRSNSSRSASSSGAVT
jgi:hypothetical protein